MTTTKYFENSLLDLTSFAIALPIQLILGLLWALFGLLWHYKTSVAATAAAVCFAAFCMTYPMFFVGLAIVAGYAYVTYPK